MCDENSRMSDTFPPRAHTRTLTNMLRSFTLLARAVLLASLIGTACAQAPDKSCCVAVYGTGPEEGNNRATVCDFCAKLATFECRPSHAPADGTVSDTSTDCISFAYADEATCLAADGAQAWWTSSDNDGFGCPATTTSLNPKPPPPSPPPTAASPPPKSSVLNDYESSATRYFTPSTLVVGILVCFFST